MFILRLNLECTFCSPVEREQVSNQQTVLRQLEAILSVHKRVKVGHYMDALREVAKLPFLPLDQRTPDIATNLFQNLSSHVQACVPDLLRIALTCLDNVTDSDGSLRALRTKVCCFIFLILSFYLYFCGTILMLFGGLSADCDFHCE